MSAFDGNRDGFLNNAERQDGREFNYGDRNNDGALNRSEFARVDSKCTFVDQSIDKLPLAFE